MIKVIDNYFILETSNTSYIFKKDESGILIHLYYGKKINSDKNTLDNLVNLANHPNGTDVRLSKEYPLVMEDVPQEVSTFGKGDHRTPMILIEDNEGNRTNLFTFESYEILKSFEYKTLPSVKDDKKEGEVLKVVLKDTDSNIRLISFYTVFESLDVITRKNIVINDRESNIKLKQAYSLNLDLRGDDLCVKTFNGNWANEMNEYNQKVTVGKYVSDTICGVSSNRTNPLIYLYKEGSTESAGESYAFNLIYSGNHSEVVERTFTGNVRVLTGMNPFTFEYTLGKGEEFEIPEAIMSYSSEGFTKLSLNMQRFVRDHIVEEKFRNFPRKVLNNSWEACYFNFNESKLLKMAKCAKSLGVELFVLDDGWFSTRNDDTQGLGDWVENKKKLPHGLKGLSDRIHKMGLEFGIWVEPEMVNEKSELFKAHPEWALKHPSRDNSLGRNQMILDLSNKDVEDYLFNSMCYVFTEANCEYVKWDANRCFSDYYSQTLPKDRMGEVHHRYYLGLYSLIRRLKERFPNILFEGCASGGNRFDLGILSYFPQIWASDDTDPFVRQRMQYSYSYGYPMSTLGCHTASSPCLNTLRVTSLMDRFSTAYMGAFGYEIDLRDESRKSKETIKEEIKFYKSIRDKLPLADYYRIRKDDIRIVCELVSEDKSLALVTDKTYKFEPIHSYTDIRLKGLDDNKNYNVFKAEETYSYSNFGEILKTFVKMQVKAPKPVRNLIARFIKVKDKEFNINLSGSALNNNYLPLNENFNGAGFNFSERMTNDFSSKFYIITEKKD